MKNFIFIAIILVSAIANAYIPPTRMILQRTSEKTGTGGFVIEQEVSFNGLPEPITLKETWTIENDRLLMVTVSTAKEATEKIQLQFLYKQNQKQFNLKNGKESRPFGTDFVEPLFHSRSLDTLAQWMVTQKFAPNSILQRKASPRRVEETAYVAESFVRLSRTGGVINYAFGVPSENISESTTGLWIEQDQFIIRKIKTHSGAEITADTYQAYGKAIEFAKDRTFRWDQQSVQVKTLSIIPKKFSPTNTLSNLNPDMQNVIGITNTESKKIIEEFYTRFR